MREILFRAKHYRTKQWVYGIPFKNPLRRSEDAYYPQIIPEAHGVHNTVNSCSIIEETIGQFTGLTDKNGVKIFEGDIVYVPDEEEAGVVAWDDESARFTIELTGLLIDFDNYSAIYTEVIGNIYDNPELVKDAIQEG